MDCEDNVADQEVFRQQLAEEMQTHLEDKIKELESKIKTPPKKKGPDEKLCKEGLTKRSNTSR